MPIEKVSEIMYNGRDNHFDSTCVDAFFQLPSHRVIAVLESEREKTATFDAEQFKNLSWQRLVELVSGGHPKRGEEGIAEVFDNIYNAGLPADYQSLD